MPEYDDYVHTQVPNSSDRLDFEGQLLVEDIRDLIGKHIFVSDRSGKYAYAFIRETPKQFKAYEVGMWFYIQYGPEESYERAEDMHYVATLNKADLVSRFGKELTVLE